MSEQAKLSPDPVREEFVRLNGERPRPMPFLGAGSSLQARHEWDAKLTGFRQHAELVETVKERERIYESGFHDGRYGTPCEMVAALNANDALRDRIKELEAERAQPTPPAESQSAEAVLIPFAWYYKLKGCSPDSATLDRLTFQPPDRVKEVERYEVHPLYLAPPSANTPAIPEGWMLVPKEPTPEMQRAGVDGAEKYGRWTKHPDLHPVTASTYRAMLAAAPVQPAVVVEVWSQTCKCGYTFAGPLNLPCPSCKQIRGGTTSGDPFIIAAAAQPEGS